MPDPKIYPCLRYEDAPAAIDWLGKAFGFEKLMVVPGPEGTVAHAELKYGPCVVMLGSVKNDPYGASPKTLKAITQTIYIGLDDPDAHCAKARAAGADVFREPVDTDYGSREYSCRDLEGHVWSFGTYRPA
jgi:uncharacterized glyoxalase superfamily protein PhnB